MSNFTKLLFAILVVFGQIYRSPTLLAQDLNYARKVIDTLCHPVMNGRGYVKGGHLKAAKFIAQEYERLQVTSFQKNNNYFQRFNISANTFPKRMELAINGKDLVVGQDFLIHPSSIGIWGEYDVVHIKEKALLGDKTFEKLLTKKFTDKVVFLHHELKNDQKLRGKLAFLKSRTQAAAYVHVNNEKLTWHISGQPQYQTELFLKKKALRFRKAKRIKLAIDNKYLTEYPTQNVLGFIEGSKYKEEFLVFTAHYDHLGCLGEHQYIAGANDNASGIALLLNLAQYYQEHPPEQSIVFMAFGAEELKLLGSKHYVENPLFPLTNIQFLINLDIVGTGDEGITVFNGRDFPTAFAKLNRVNQTKNYLPHIKPKKARPNSDQWPFFEQNVPCFFIHTNGGIQAYHDIYDRPETLPLTAFDNLFRLLVDFVDTF